ncbi:hypothetical protein EV639_109111 [Rathayibacter tanaceti]|uniref:Uncharacterized protein n=2 Tax=Rathayibacter tanaceti TaxID=1671680 RepID=A0ACD2XHF8_9MICO|nr:hypothetical protein ACH61_02685 [Rathayibacter tanaceti]TCO35107.1 hypothetical protein EV639_109111 [Rathayibacter tanaceti]
MTDPAFAVLDELIAALEQPGAIDLGLGGSVVARARTLRGRPGTLRPRQARSPGHRLVRPASATTRTLLRRRFAVPGTRTGRRPGPVRRLRQARTLSMPRPW